MRAVLFFVGMVKLNYSDLEKFHNQTTTDPKYFSLFLLWYGQLYPLTVVFCSIVYSRVIYQAEEFISVSLNHVTFVTDYWFYHLNALLFTIKVF